VEPGASFSHAGKIREPVMQTASAVLAGRRRWPEPAPLPIK
jgi:hypothetical protein